MSEITTAEHLEDHQLLHLVDGDASNFEMDQWTKHVLSCAECSTRLIRLQRISAGVSTRIAEVELPTDFRLPELPQGRTRRFARPAPSGSTHRWARAAALILVLLAPLALVQPLRAWVAEQIAGGWESLSEWLAPDGASEGPGAGAEGGSSRILFTAPGPVFTVELSSFQSAGELLLTRSGGAEGALQLRGDAQETPLFYDGGVRIANDSGSVSSYDLVLPVDVHEVVVRVDGQPLSTIPISASTGQVRIDLSSPGSR